MYVDFTEADVPTEKTYAETMKEKYPILYAKFGEDETKYQQYYDDNKPYFYGGEGSYTLSSMTMLRLGGFQTTTSVSSTRPSLVWRTTKRWSVLSEY